VADLASIETAVIAWITGCEPLLGVFRQGLDPYKVFATHLFNKPYEEVTRAERGFCKPPVLGCGYRLGGGTLLNGVRTGLWGYAEALGVDMTREEAQRAVGVYRSQYPEVVDFWTALENGAQRVMESGGKTKVGPLTFERRSPFLLLRLPLNDRPLFYYRPAMGWRRVLSGRMVERQSRGWDLDGAPEGETIIVEDTWMAYGLSYSGKNQKTRQWCRIDTHGGRTIEQATQGLARDILAVGIKRAHQDGFTVIGHSHDEVVTLQRKDDHCHTAERLAGLMTAPIPGLEGLPLGAASFVSDYYRKD
jgi:DNA polymerase